MLVAVAACPCQLVSRPQAFDVMVTPNFYGSLVSNCVAGLSHGAGFVSGANVGDDGAIFEQGTRHVGMDIAGRDEVNPTGARAVNSTAVTRQPPVGSCL